MTGSGQAMGTADYMAPEQASDSHTVDIRADLYSLGCTLYKLLSGRAPFSGPEYRGTLDKLNAHVRQPVPPIRQLVSAVPDGLAAILDRLLAKSPDDRFATPAEVAAALAPFCKDADLPALIQRAVEAENRSAAVPAAWGGQDARVPVIPQPASWGWRSITTILALLLLVGGLGFALGILITIRKDGRQTAIDVPDGSKTQITAQGNVDVDLPDRQKSTEPVLSSPRQHWEPPLQFGPVVERVVNALGHGAGGERSAWTRIGWPTCPSSSANGRSMNEASGWRTTKRILSFRMNFKLNWSRRASRCGSLIPNCGTTLAGDNCD